MLSTPKYSWLVVTDNNHQYTDTKPVDFDKWEVDGESIIEIHFYVSGYNTYPRVVFGIRHGMELIFKNWLGRDPMLYDLLPESRPSPKKLKSYCFIGYRLGDFTVVNCVDMVTGEIRMGSS